MNKEEMQNLAKEIISQLENAKPEKYSDGKAFTIQNKKILNITYDEEKQLQKLIKEHFEDVRNYKILSCAVFSAGFFNGDVVLRTID